MTMMPTPEEFMMLTVEPDEDVEPDGFFAPASVELFQRLDRRVSDLERHIGLTDKVAADPEPLVSEDEHVALMIDTSHELADLEAKHDIVLQLVEQIRSIVKKSTSKVSLDVKAAIDAWANPPTSETPSPAGEPSPSAGEGSYTGLRTEVDAEGRTVLSVPAHDADVDEWRTYARALRGVTNGESSIDSMNRSQIRTLLGIEQPAGA